MFIFAAGIFPQDLRGDWLRNNERVRIVNLRDEVIQYWEANRSTIGMRLNSWLENLRKNNVYREQTKRVFHNWSPLVTYVSIGKTGHIFSIRFLGQEVGEIVVEDRMPYLVVTKKKEKTNLFYFNGGSIKDGKCLWDSKEAKRFRKFFKDLPNPERTIKFRSKEHIIESRIISDMKNGSLKKIQPVMIANKFPLQMPVPFGGCAAKPKLGVGHIDILARRGIGRNTYLSVWELKKPKTLGNAIQQVYIYAVTLILMLRSDMGREWYWQFGFKRKLPDHLKIECVVAISEDKKTEFENKFIKLRDYMPNRVGKDTIQFSVAYYDETKPQIKLQEPNECI